jgi:hypothetical protein
VPWYVRESALLLLLLLLLLRLNTGATELKFGPFRTHSVYTCLRTFLATAVPSSIATRYPILSLACK